MIFVLWALIWPYVLLAAAVAIVFGRALSGEFLSWDDTQHFALNPWLQSGEVGHFWRTEYYGLYIPLAYTLWTWIYHIWPAPVAFHLLNLVLHILNTWMVFWLAHKVLSSRKKDTVEMLERGRVLFALLAALLFALHPFQVETVAWISGGRDLLAAFFGMGATILAWNTADRLFPTWAALLRRVAATAFYVGAVLCKPALAVLPPAVKCLSWFTERRGLKWPMMWTWLGLGALVAGITLQVQSAFVTTRLPVLNWTEKVIVAGDTLWFYLRKFVVLDFFSVDYGRTAGRVLSGELSSVSPWLYLGVLFVAILLASRFLPGAVKGGLGFFVIMLLPVLGIWGFSAQAFSTVSDRYMYLPMAGLAFAFASAVSEIKIRYELRLFVAFMICGWWGWISFQRVPDWLNDRSLAEATLKVNPGSYNAMINLGIAETKAGRIPEARVKFESAYALDARLAVAPANLAHIYWLEKNPAGVIELGRLLSDAKFIDYNQQEPQALSLMARMLGRVLVEQGNFEKGREALCYAAKANPYDKDLADELAAFLRGHPEQKTCD
jgi:hypothetical protein